MHSDRFFSVDSPKAIKADKYGYVNGINYMAPASTAGEGNMCPHASPGCLALCLGWYSGQAGMLSNAKLESGNNAARASRQRKVREFMHNRKAFLEDMYNGVRACQRRAKRLGKKLCIRLNGATDITWESVFPLIFVAFPEVQFVDYTKNYKRMLRFCEGKLPSNYHLTFSRSETNEDQCHEVLKRGGNVAVVFADKTPYFHTGFYGYPVVDGDEHDLRHLDPKGGVVIGLSPKGRKAKADTSGFVVRI